MNKKSQDFRHSEKLCLFLILIKRSKNMANYIIGVVIGLVVALIIVLILKNTVFKDKSMTLLYVAIFIIMAVCGSVIQNQFFSASASSAPTPQEQIDNITSTIEDNWKNTNGGFTFEQIKLAQDDNECPSYADQIIDLKCYDYGSYVVFSFYDGGVYQNAVFYKSSDGLILDGIMNMHAEMTGIKWFLAYNTDSFKWVDGRDKESNYTISQNWIVWQKHDNLLSVSRQTPDFLVWQYTFRTNKDEAYKYALSNVATLTGQNITSHFIKFGDVELIGTGSTGYVKINSFYNYLYEQIKGEQYNTTKLIDASSCLCLPIPTALQPNYPISPSKQAEYDGAEFYGVYRCNIAVDLNYVKGNTTLNSTTKNEDYVDTLKEDDDYKDKVEVEEVQPGYSYSKLNVNFIDTNNSDLSKIDLMMSPINISFTCQDLGLTKTVVIDSVDKLKTGVEILVNKDANWNYLIDSEALIFDNFRGSFTVKDDTSTITFPYYYLDNFTIASVGLNPIGTIDSSLIDLATNPVRIILSNDKNTYQFVFNSNSDLNTYKSTLVEMGTYDYTILSEQLIFASVTGQLTINSTDKVMLFNYALGADDPLTFDIEVTTNGTTNNRFSLYSETSNVTLIRETLSSAKVYLVTCVIYDKDGKLMETFDHTHQVTGACSDTWTASNLVSGEEYTLQLRFTDRDDSSITYLSDIANFTFNSNTAYKVEYFVTKNQ